MGLVYAQHTLQATSDHIACEARPRLFQTAGFLQAGLNTTDRLQWKRTFTSECRVTDSVSPCSVELSSMLPITSDRASYSSPCPQLVLHHSRALYSDIYHHKHKLLHIGACACADAVTLLFSSYSLPEPPPPPCPAPPPSKGGILLIGMTHNLIEHRTHKFWQQVTAQRLPRVRCLRSFTRFIEVAPRRSGALGCA